jgi:Lon-like ATP-dependent protease
LADFQEMEPSSAQAIYSEYEDNLQIADADTLKQWCQWVWQNAQQLGLPGLAADAWPLLIQEAARYTGDQETLPLCPLWIARQLREAAAFCEGEEITAKRCKPCWRVASGVKAISLSGCRMKSCRNRS